ncbi:DUF5916 domain-containing protein [uncultured Maribacter sp.]|uniref:DUF5916 domain-containing protein n=1 Tax=uncultured Maribacter sp. TaxID=431308 RepID=UPI00260BD8A0|nr:DUF5916 domain-containing protein [uncultured Maribacter sp.]
MTKYLAIVSLIFISQRAFSQSKSFTVKHISKPIIADGILDEPIWKVAEGATEFWEYFPIDSIQARQQSNIKMVYDDVYLYVGIKINTAGKNYRIQSLKRDFRAGNSDNITLLFDTFNDSNNAFIFGSNPYGVRREGLLSGGGRGNGAFNMSWDAKWVGDSKIYDNYYTSEFKIPLTSFKFKEGETKWRFNSYRFDTQSNETSTWVNIPQNQTIFDLGYMGTMIFEKPLGKSRTPLAIIPYINTISQKDFETNDKINNIKFGGDAKIAIGNSMNLDITVNPDFSQVEVDDQVTNLTRFEVSLPEKRQFFIDNSDLFSSFGGRRDANPFFSRRIGIAKDTADNSIENKIIGGLRLSGKLNKNLRLGFMNLQTEEDIANEIPSNNNAMLALQQRVFSRSNIGLFLINRESIKNYDFLSKEDRYNRVIGIDYNMVSADNTWSGKYYIHKSFEPNTQGKDLSIGASLQYNSKNYNIFTDWVSIGDNFTSDLGFIRREDIVKGVLGMERIFWPNKGKIQMHSFTIFPEFIWSPTLDYINTDYNLTASWSATYNNQARVNAQITKSYTFLMNDFDPTNTDEATAIPGNIGYHYNSIDLQFRSDRRKLFAYILNTTVGEFFNGERYSFGTTMTMRFQPKVFLSLIANYDKISLPTPHPSADIWLISPKIDITFSKSIFWSTLVQYSNQRDNLGFNSRLQWRFAPLSDLFIVYNDNYFVNSFEPKNRSINLKLTYWLNI